MYVDPTIVNLYFWIHVILLGIVGGIWLYQLPPDVGEDKLDPKDEDEGWPDWYK